MNRMGIPQPDYTPDGVLAEIARVVPAFKGAVRENLGDNGKQWPIQEGCIGRRQCDHDGIEDLERDGRLA
jgi:predicted molibdopterin-dependent oxidoreductase YjgC